MLSCPGCAYSSIPKEFRKTAEALFPATGGAGGKDTALAFAGILGIEPHYRNVLGDGGARPLGAPPPPQIAVFLKSFRSNLDLLIQKTWVEKNDEDRKERLLARIPGLEQMIENAEYPEALVEFASVLEEVAWLLFGAQSRKNDFTEYTFRIDTQMGLFWWYAGQLARVIPEIADRTVVRMVLLLGLCYLTDF